MIQPVVSGGGGMSVGGTVTGGTAGRLLYVGSGPVLAEAVGLTYATSGTHLTLTAQAATDVPGAVQMHASQSASAWEVRNSAGTARGGWGPQSTVNDSLALFLRPSSRTYYMGTHEANGTWKWGRSDSAATMAFSPDESLGTMRFDGSPAVQIHGGGSTSTLSIAARLDGGSTIVDFNRRPSDNSTGVGGTARCWTKTAQATNAFEVLVPGGAGLRLAATPAGVVQQWQDTSTTNRQQSAATASWADSTDATRKARVVFDVYDTAARECLRLEASGTAAMLGFLGATATAREALAADATDLATAIALVNDIKAKLVTKGLCS
jgi:hypothetical protein